MIEQGSTEDGQNGEDDEDGYIDDDFPDYYPGDEPESIYMEPVNVQSRDEGKCAFICNSFNTIPQ